MEKWNVCVIVCHVKPTGVVVVHIPFLYVAYVECRAVMLYGISAIAIDVIRFPCHGYGVQAYYLGAEQRIAQMRVDHLLNFVE